MSPLRAVTGGHILMGARAAQAAASRPGNAAVLKHLAQTHGTFRKWQFGLASRQAWDDALARCADFVAILPRDKLAHLLARCHDQVFRQVVLARHEAARPVTVLTERSAARDLARAHARPAPEARRLAHAGPAPLAKLPGSVHVAVQQDTGKRLPDAAPGHGAGFRRTKMTTATPLRTILQHALDTLREAVAFEPRDPDHFAGPGFRQQEPELAAELRHAARG